MCLFVCLPLRLRVCRIPLMRSRQSVKTGFVAKFDVLGFAHHVYRIYMMCTLVDFMRITCAYQPGVSRKGSSYSEG